MEMSGTIAELAKALSKAQGEMKGAKKDSTNPHFKSQYADLESSWDACRGPLSKNGLSVVQIPFDSDGKIGTETILMHESGEWIKGTISVKMAQDTNPQVAGSILTYLRRYSLQGAVGISPADDDGNAAAGKATPQAEEKPAPVLDPAILHTFESAQTADELKAAWNAVPVGSRHGYTAAKDAAKARVAAAGKAA